MHLNIFAPSYALLFSQMTCYHCQSSTPAMAIWVPSFDDIDEEDGYTTSVDHQGRLKYIELLDTGAAEMVSLHAPWVQRASTRTSGTSYLAHHCTTCGSLQGDHFLFEIDGPFGPQTDEELSAVRRLNGDGELRARAVAVF